MRLGEQTGWGDLRDRILTFVYYEQVTIGLEKKIGIFDNNTISPSPLFLVAASYKDRCTVIHK